MSASKKIELEVSGYVDLLVGDHDCLISVSTLLNLDKLATIPAQSRYLHNVLMKDDQYSDCLAPSDVQDGVEYDNFRAEIKEALLSSYADGNEGMLQLECLGSREDTRVSYAWKSKYGGHFWESKPLLLRRTKSTMLKLKGFFSSDAKKERAQRKTLPLRDELVNNGSASLVAKDSFEAFQYCYELYLRKIKITNSLSSKAKVSNSV